MGGRGSGGRRPGSGEKPKVAYLRAMDGGSSHRAKPADVAVAPVPVERFGPPEDMSEAVLAVWHRLASHAFDARTLTRATEYSFLLLCRNVVLEATLAESEPGSAAHRGVVQRIDAELLRFSLSPNGKALYEAVPVAEPKNPLSKFLA